MGRMHGLIVGGILLSAADLAQATPPSLMVWVDRQHADRPNSLQTEVAVNGTRVDIFARDGQKAIDKLLQKGWNKIVLRTFPRGTPAENQLLFHFGAAVKGPKANQYEMDPILWELRNGTGWEIKDGKWKHPGADAAQEVTLTYTLYYGGLQHDPPGAKLKEGDYVCSATPMKPVDSPVTATVFINGTGLTSFVGNRRNVIITPLLKQGRNEIKLVTHAVKNSAATSDFELMLAGPARFNAMKKDFEFQVISTFRAGEGWVRDRRTGKLVNQATPEAETVEQVFPLFLDAAPRPGAGK